MSGVVSGEALADTLCDNVSLSCTSCTVYVLLINLGEGGLLVPVPVKETLEVLLEDDMRLDESGGVGGGVGEAESPRLPPAPPLNGNIGLCSGFLLPRLLTL